MPLRLPPLFLELLASNDSRALALLARNLALLKVVDKVWWLHGTGKTQQVAENTLLGIQKLMQPEWEWTMKWPLQLAGDNEMGYRYD